MLTGDLLRVRRAAGLLTPRYLDRAAGRRLEPVVEALLATLDTNVGERREDLEAALDSIDHGPRDRLVVAGLRKLLLDRCSFETSDGVEPSVLRREVFQRAAERRRELGARDAFDREAVLAEAAATLEMAPETVERRLFADLRMNERMTAFRSITPKGLLERYDVALAQGVLLRATKVALALDDEEPGRLRQLFRAARFHGLLHRVRRLDDKRWLIELDGPLSLFSSVQKYGLKLALFLPAVLRCTRWRLRADVLWGKARNAGVFELGPEQGLVPHDRRITGVSPELADFVERFRALGSPWRIDESGEIFALPDEAACVPDLVFVHEETGETVYLEAFGFWSRQAVWQRIETLRRGFPARILLAAGKQLRVREELLDDSELGELYVYKTRMLPRAVLERLEAGGG